MSQVPISPPTDRRIRIATIAVLIPATIAFCTSNHLCPFLIATIEAIAAASVSTIWLGPDEESEPNSATDSASISTSATIGIRASTIEGGLGVVMLISLFAAAHNSLFTIPMYAV